MLKNNWLLDLPQQFQDREFITVLIRAFSRQMEELYQVCDDLVTKVDVDTATGKNLDYVGGIVNLSRKEAGILAGFSDEDPDMSDDRYRKYLRYQILCNNSSCTYEEIMESINLLWDIEKVQYYEDPARPATVFIRLLETDVDEVDPTQGKPQIVKASGVGFIYAIDYITKVDERYIERFDFPSLNIKFPLYEMPKTEANMWLRINAGTIENKESVSVSLVSKRNLWYLDGTYNLDGEMYLNAGEVKEEL